MSFIQLSKSALFNNLDIIAQKTADKDKIALVLKDNAYGHGLIQIAQLAHEYGITKSVVRREEEAEQIQDFFDYVLILAPQFPVSNHPKFVYTINALGDIEKFAHGSRVELKIDTGMHRNGITADEAEKAMQMIHKKGLKLEGIFTHHRSADTMSAEWFWQKKNFEAIKQKYPGLRYHSCNSAALFREKNFDEDMVRIGIAAYGCLEMDRGFDAEGLEPVLSLYGQRISSRTVSKGQRVGYNATFEAPGDVFVSNYDVGYADGLSRRLSNRYKTPDGVALIGRVSMDNSSYISDKEELLIFHDAREIASYCETIAYEMLTSLSHAIPRHIV